MQTIRVFHEYFEGPWFGVSFQPDLISQELMRKHQIVFRETADGFFIAATDSEKLPEDVLRFLCYPENRDYVYFTELQPRGSLIVFRCEPEQADVQELFKPLESYKQIQPHQPPCFLIEIPVNTKNLVYQIRLKAKSLRWKYILNSPAVFPDLEIIDTTGKNAPMLFEQCSESPLEEGICWITKEKIELRAQPAQRFQLREVKSGKIVMKRLPCANGKLLVKEKNAEGEMFPAAEVYLNP